MQEPLVFLPGLMCDARLFGPQIATLSAQYPVMAVPLTWGERVEEIASAVLDVVPARFSLVGHGLGGMVAIEMLRRAPERVSRIALMDTSPLPETPQQASDREPRMIRARTGRLDMVMAEEILEAGLAPGPQRTDVQHLVTDMALGLGVEAYVRQGRALQRRRDQQSTLRRVAVPALVLCGVYDAAHPVKRHAFMAELIPDATHVVVEGAGHFPTLEAPEVVTDTLRVWLDTPLMLR